MVTKELVDYIRDQLQLSVGEIIRENLRSHGWKENDIDNAFAQALLKTPYAAAPMPKKSHKTLYIILALIIALLVPLAIGLYSYFGKQQAPKVESVPTPTKPVPTPTTILPVSGFSDITVKVRDTKRKLDLTYIVGGLDILFTKNGSYPDSLSDLKDISLHKDPESGEEYEYTSKQNGADYELCATFETTGRQCVSSTVKVNDLP